MNMKKWWAVVTLLLCCVCCGSVAETKFEVKDYDEFVAALDSKAAWIQLTADITLTQDVTVGYDTHIDLNGHFVNEPSEDSDVKLIIAEGASVTIGVDVNNTTNVDFSSGGVKANVENQGLIIGSAAFYGKVTNYGEIGAADCFYGEYIPMSGSSNLSYVKLTLDLDSYVPASTPEGWEQEKDQLSSKKIIRGQILTQSLPAISREGYELEGWQGADQQLLDGEAHLTGDLTVTADWSLKDGTTLYELKFDENGGDGQTDSQWFVMGETRTLHDRDKSKKDRWNYLGWNTEQDGTGRAYDEGDAFTYNGTVKTLYAQWEKNVEIESTEGVYSVHYYSGSDWLFIEGNMSYMYSPYTLKTLEALQGYKGFNPDFTIILPFHRTSSLLAGR